MLDVSYKLSLPIIATHEVFYLEKEMHEAHDAYLCVGEKTYVNVKDRRKYTNEHYLKTILTWIPSIAKDIAVLLFGCHPSKDLHLPLLLRYQLETHDNTRVCYLDQLKWYSKLTNHICNNPVPSHLDTLL